jgi:hypothetical protein
VFGKINLRRHLNNKHNSPLESGGVRKLSFLRYTKDMNTRGTYPRPLSLTTIPARAIFMLVQQLCQQHPRPHRRGRKPVYREEIILTLMLVQNSREASLRQVLYAIAPEALPGQPVPSLSTFVYRKGRVGEERLEQLLQWVARQGIDVVGLVYWGGGRRWVVGLRLGEAYSDEGRLLSEWLGEHGAGVVGAVALLVGDKLYGYRAQLLKQIEGVVWLPAVRVGAGLHQGVRAPSRLRALSRLEEYGWALRERYRIEDVFGSVKGAYGSYSEGRSYRNACMDVYRKFVLWNMVKLLEVLGEKGLRCLLLWCWLRLIFEHPPES